MVGGSVPGYGQPLVPCMYVGVTCTYTESTALTAQLRTTTAVVCEYMHTNSELH